MATQYIALSSADPTNPGHGTPLGNAVFKNSFTPLIKFGEQSDYEVALFSISINLASTFDPALEGSLFVYSNFADSAQVLGSVRAPLLRRIRIDAVGGSEINPTLLMYVPLGACAFSTGTIEIRTGTGSVPAMDPAQGTSVTLAVRRKLFS